MKMIELQRIKYDSLADGNEPTIQESGNCCGRIAKKIGNKCTSAVENIKKLCCTQIGGTSCNSREVAKKTLGVLVGCGLCSIIVYFIPHWLAPET